MKNEWTFMRRFAVVSMVSGLAWASLGAMNAEGTGNAGLATDSRLDMVTTLCGF